MKLPNLQGGMPMHMVEHQYVAHFMLFQRGKGHLK